MHACMNDGAHDRQHVYRVLYAALELAEERRVDLDVLIAAALLHDIGRDAQYRDARLDHAAVGAEMAFDFLRELGWPEPRAGHVRDCVRTHRFRGGDEPASMEARILFDADKLDVTGTLGIARTLAYQGIVAEPLYSLDQAGDVLDGDGDAPPSFFHEYRWKLQNVGGRLYTERARRIAEERRVASEAFYQAMRREVRGVHREGNARLERLLGPRTNEEDAP